MPRWGAVHADQPVSTRSLRSGTVAGAPTMPIAGPIVCSWIDLSGTITGSTDEPRISRAEVMLMTGRSPGARSRVMT